MSSPVTITRGRLAKFAAALALGSAVVSGGTAWAVQTFSDVPPSNAFFDEIEWGAANGIIGGYSDGTFRPGKNVSRQAVAAFMARYNDSIHTVSAAENPGSGNVFYHDTSCPAGERVLTGDGSTTVSDLFMTDSFAVDADTWRVRWESDNDGTKDPSEITVTVLCAPPLLP